MTQSIWRIKENVLETLLHASRSTFPNEFGAFLKAKDNTIYELALIPGTIQGESHTIFKLYMLPLDPAIVGTVHSHPSHNNRPSRADLQFFEKTGQVHLIVRRPYEGPEAVAAYNRGGAPITLRIVK